MSNNSDFADTSPSNTHAVYVEWIDHIRREHSITATGIARKIGVSPSTISRQIKAGWTKLPQLDIVGRIAREFNEQVPKELVGNIASNLPDPGPELVDVSDSGDDSVSSDSIVIKVCQNVLASVGCLVDDLLIFDRALQPTEGDIVLAEVFQYGQKGSKKVIRVYLPPYLVAAEFGRPTRRPLIYNSLSEEVKLLGTLTKRIHERK